MASKVEAVGKEHLQQRGRINYCSKGLIQYERDGMLMAEFNTAVKRTLGFILLVCVCVGQTACTTTKPVVVPAGVRLEANISQQYDSISRDHIRFIWLTPGVQHDTLHILDSIYIDRWRVKTDSIVRVDTVTHVVEIVKPGNQFLVRSGIALWVIIVLIVLAIAAGIFIKFAK